MNPAAGAGITIFGGAVAAGVVPVGVGVLVVVLLVVVGMGGLVLVGVEMGCAAAAGPGVTVMVLGVCFFLVGFVVVMVSSWVFGLASEWLDWVLRFFWALLIGVNLRLGGRGRRCRVQEWTQERLPLSVRHLSNALRHLSNALRHLSNALRHLSNALRHLSSALRQLSSALRHPSNALRHLPHALHHTPSRFLSLLSRAGRREVRPGRNARSVASPPLRGCEGGEFGPAPGRFLEIDVDFFRPPHPRVRPETPAVAA